VIMLSFRPDPKAPSAEHRREESALRQWLNRDTLCFLA
jgi:hypothetical protein